MRARIARPIGLPVYAGLAVVLTVLADRLFYDHPVGITAALFAIALGVAIAAANPVPRQRPLLPSLLLLGGAVLALAETVSLLSLALAAACLALFALAARGRLAKTLAGRAGQVARFLWLAPVRLLQDNRARRVVRHRKAAPVKRGPWVCWAGWLMPLGLAGGFLALFAMANPVLDLWLSRIDLWFLLDLAEPMRLIFWALALGLSWAFVRPRLKGFRNSKERRSDAVAFRSAPASTFAAAAVPPSTFATALFAPRAILRALWIFNVVFAAQTVLDAVYLWGGAALPDGITYAAYAHRGAYPLVATALIAAAFVLFAMRPGTRSAGDRRIRRLVLLWTGQNVLLVLSSILRLDLYIEAYSLTYWRVGAFVWMGLVAFGLAAIMARIVLNLSNSWLVGVNLGALASVVFLFCFIDVAALIARFNVEHSRELTGMGAFLDEDYLTSLGPAALPAIDRYIAFGNGGARMDDPFHVEKRDRLRYQRATLAFRHQREFTMWRAWTFRGWRLSRYLEASEPVLADSTPR